MEQKTIDAHISTIRELARLTSDDSVWSDEFIYKLMIDKRAKILSQEADKWNTLSQVNYSRFCVELEVGRYQDCQECIPAGYGEYLMRSCLELPDPLSGKFYDLLQVFKLDGTSISRVDRTNYRLRKYSKLGIRPGYMFDNNRIWVYCAKFKIVELRGIFYDPTEITEDLAGDTCYDPLTTKFPFDPKFNESMYNMVLNDLGISARFPEDRSNNAESNTSQVQT